MRMENKKEMWSVPLVDKVENVNKDMIVLEHPRPDEAAMNAYKLPSIEKAIRYLHSAADFLTNETRLKSIKSGNYVAWLLVNMQNVKKIFRIR